MAVGQGQEHQSISLTDTSVHLEMSPEMFPGMSSGMSLCDIRILLKMSYNMLKGRTSQYIVPRTEEDSISIRGNC